MFAPIRKNLVFMGSSLKDLKEFPVDIQKVIGFKLDDIQCGRIPKDSKAFKGIRGVMELVINYSKDTYRAVYILNIKETVFVLHCFKKKSKHGIKTPKQDVKTIQKRYKDAIKLSR